MAKILIEKNIMVPMRDGVQLATDIYRLEGAAPIPLMARTLYHIDRLVAVAIPSAFSERYRLAIS